MNAENERRFLNISQLSLRSLVIGAIGSCIITASSMYVALKMGALPWPTIFVSVLSMALLKILGKTTLNEINVTQTNMSSGAMVAGGIAFTLPGLWITGAWTDMELSAGRFWQVLGIATAGMILGTILTWFLRPRFIEKDKLPYPIGVAAAETITTGDAGGKKSIILFSTMGLSAIYTYVRDGLAKIPQAITWKWMYERDYFVGIMTSPMAVGIGYMIGTLYTGVWFLGAFIAYFMIIPLGIAFGFFENSAQAYDFKNTAGIGLMVGTGVGVLISFLVNYVRRVKTARQQTESFSTAVRNSSNRARLIVTITVLISFFITVACGLGVIPSLLLILGVFATSAMAATITGETGINPMEIFGIIVLLAIRSIVFVGHTGAFLIAACVAVACGYAGDMLNDYKTGNILGTDPKAQLISQFVGGAVGTVISAVAMFAVINQAGGVGPEYGLYANQAFAVSQMIEGIGNPVVFFVSALIGAALYVMKVPSMTLGIGLYLPFEISSAVFLGGLIRFIVDKFSPKSVDEGTVAASGLLGGEGITGVTIAIINMLLGK